MLQRLRSPNPPREARGVGRGIAALAALASPFLSLASRTPSSMLPWRGPVPIPRRRDAGGTALPPTAAVQTALDAPCFRALADAVRDAVVWLALPTLRHAYVARSYLALSGCGADEIVGSGVFERVHDDDAAALAAFYAAVADGTSAVGATFSYRLRHGSGRWLWCETTAVAIRIEGGAAEGLICTIRDVDAPHRADAAKSASEARFRLLAENASELIVFGHDDGRRSYISPASTRLFGLTPDELDAEMRRKRWVHPDDVDTLARLELGQTGGEAAVTCRVRHRDGTWIWVEAIVRRVNASTENEPTIIATFRDITERQIQAQALRKAKDDADRARLCAEQASRAKSDFLAVMSHEIRTPLNAILGFADLLQAGATLPGESRRHVERICNAGTALRTIVDDILDFSRLEAGHVDLEVRPLHPSVLVDDALSIVEGLAAKKQLRLVAALDPAVPGAVVGDYARLRQILVNLLNNAVKFTQQGEVRLALKRRGDLLRFSITDTGIGVPPGELESIFERFSQVDGTMSREYGGTGLGLAICRRLVRAMGGTIGVESAVQQGSTFWFELALPSADGHPTTMPAEASPAPGSFDELLALAAEGPENPPPAAPRSLNILLVEDVVLNQELICCLLQAQGHRIDLVGNGSEAIMAVSDKTYDLVLMDLQMPYVDGITAAVAIRHLAHPGRFVPMVALTAAVLREQLDLALAAGMNDVLAKPICMTALGTLLQRASRDEIREPADPEALEADSAMDLARALGDAKVRSMHLLLRSSLIARFNVPLTDSSAAMLKAEAHASIAGAAMLGFVRFATMCRRFIAAEGDDARAAYAVLLRELYHVVRTAERLGKV